MHAWHRRRADEPQDFVTKILALDKNAHIIVGGDFNEFSHAWPMRNFVKSSRLQQVENVVEPIVDPVERYTYVNGPNSQQLDYFFLSNASARDAHVDHVHVNTGGPSDAALVSDHDPIVMLVDVCG